MKVVSKKRKYCLYSSDEDTDELVSAQLTGISVVQNGIHPCEPHAGTAATLLTSSFGLNSDGNGQAASFSAELPGSRLSNADVSSDERLVCPVSAKFKPGPHYHAAGRVADKRPESLPLQREKEHSFTIEIPRLRYPKSCYWDGYKTPKSSNEAEILHKMILAFQASNDDSFSSSRDPSSTIGRLPKGEYHTIIAEDVSLYQVYRPGQHSAGEETKHEDNLGFCSPAQLLLQAQGTVYMDATIRSEGTTDSHATQQLSAIPLSDVSISIDLEGFLRTWVAGPTSHRYQAWYELLSSSDEYRERWSEFQWLGDFTRFSLGFLESYRYSGYSCMLADFKEGFQSFLNAQNSPQAESLQAAYGKTDWRQAITTHSDFVWHVCHGLPVQKSPLFSEIFCTDLKAQSWSPSDKTIVSPYVFDCFEHIFGGNMKVVQPKADKQPFSHVEIHELQPEVRITSSDDINVGDFVSLKVWDDEDNLWLSPTFEACISKSRSKNLALHPLAKPSTNDDSIRSLTPKKEIAVQDSGDDLLISQSFRDDLEMGYPEPRTSLSADQSEQKVQAKQAREYMYITEKIPKSTLLEPERYVYRGLWCYRPNTWHTQLGHSFYPHSETELFLSDHCNCPENYIDHQFLEITDFDCKVSVNMYRDTPDSCQFFCRSMYLHDEGNFITLQREHLDSSAEKLPCDCLTKPMRLQKQMKDYLDDFQKDFRTGDPILLDNGQPLLQPCILHSLCIGDRSATFIEMERKQFTDPHAMPNELYLTSRMVRLTVSQLRKRVIRSYGLWYISSIRQDELPRPLQLHGSGEQFFFRSKISMDPSGLDGSSESSLTTPAREDIDWLRLQTGLQPLKKLRGLDLFAGAGNLGEGIRDAGIVQYAHVVDLFSEALHTHRANHISMPGDDLLLQTEYYFGSVNRFLETQMKRGRGNVSQIDFIVAGSPCQGFSQANVSKNDEKSLRNCSLIANFASYLDFYRPKYALLENVPGLAENVRLPGGRIVNVHRQLLAMAVGLGYQVRTFTSHACLHGSAQARGRIFIIFAAPGLSLPLPPVQSHEFPANHPKQEKLRGPHGNVYHNVRNVHGIPRTFKTRVLRDIWQDLPNIEEGQGLCISHPYHRIHARPSYSERTICRSYGGFAVGVKSKVSHALRSRPGQSSRRHARTLKELHDVHVLPESLHAAFPVMFQQFSTSYGRTDPDRLIGTVLTNPFPKAKLGSPCIHYEQPRRYTIEEAKRAQGFLNDDLLLGSPYNKMKQIGNSVSRHVSYAVGVAIRDAMQQDHKMKSSSHPGAAGESYEAVRTESSEVNSSGTIRSTEVSVDDHQ